MKNIYHYDLEGLKEAFKELGVPAFRAKQVWGWLYDKGCRDFDAMSNLSKSLRAQLSAHFTFGTLEVATEQVSADGTRKRVYRLTDG